MLIKLKKYLYRVFDESNLILEFNENVTVKDVFGELNHIYGEAFQENYGKPLLEAFSEDFNVFLNQDYIKNCARWMVKGKP